MFVREGETTCPVQDGEGCCRPIGHDGSHEACDEAREDSEGICSHIVPIILRLEVE